MENPETEIHLDEEKARAGETPHIARYVLIVGLALAILALSAIWIGMATQTSQGAEAGLESSQAFAA